MEEEARRFAELCCDEVIQGAGLGVGELVVSADLYCLRFLGVSASDYWVSYLWLIRCVISLIKLQVVKCWAFVRLGVGAPLMEG